MSSVITLEPKEENWDYIWKCQCGSFSFFLFEDRVECTDCDVEQVFEDEGDDDDHPVS